MKLGKPMTRLEKIQELRRINHFLASNGIKIVSCSEILKEGDLIALPYSRGGFYAFVTNGQEQVRRDKPRILYNQDLEEVGERRGMRRSVIFNPPTRCYYALLNQAHLPSIIQECWFQLPEDAQSSLFTVGRAQLERGVYLLTDSNLVEMIRDTFAQADKERGYR